MTEIFNKPHSLTILVQFVWEGPGRYIWMWQLKKEISRECNDIIGSAKGSQISEKYWGEVGKGKRVISLRLGFRRNFLLGWRTDRKFLRNPNLNEIREKSRCLPWSKEEEGAYIFWIKQVPVILWYSFNGKLTRIWISNITETWCHPSSFFILPIRVSWRFIWRNTEKSVYYNTDFSVFRQIKRQDTVYQYHTAFFFLYNFQTPTPSPWRPCLVCAIKNCL
jgi:hypothetical protein